MRQILKYELIQGHGSMTTARTPRNPKIISVGQQNGSLVAWVECDIGPIYHDVWICAVATGHEFPEGWSHIGTVQMPSGLVWHLYEGS